jgi:diguanylate cyclase (GGDEF)-like protein
LKHLFLQLPARLFAFTISAPGTVITIQERERIRKRRLFNIVLLANFVWLVSMIPIAILENIGSIQIYLDISGCLTSLLAIWINWRGYMRGALLLFILTTAPGAMITIVNLARVTPITLFSSWVPLLFFSLIAGFFLPLWGTLLMTLLKIVFLYWLILINSASIIIHITGDPTYPKEFFLTSSAMILGIALVSAFSSWIASVMVFQAAVDLEITHNALNKAYLDLGKAHIKIQQQTLIDHLTGLPNHQAMVDFLEKGINHAQNREQTFSLLFIDLDHFKALNDGYGHAAGDATLHELGQILSKNLRNIDTTGRWGGEEFLAILPETAIDEALLVAENIREVVSKHIFSVGGGLHLTCSIGIASYPTHVYSLDSLINAADQAMCAAKRLGRNQVRTVDEPLVRMAMVERLCENDRETTAIYGLVDALFSVVERRNFSLREHSNKVAGLVYQLALKLGISSHEAHMIKLAGHLHDIGKVGIPDAILQKPSPLTEQEWQHMMLHPIIGAEVAACIPALRPLAPVIRAHHEWWDGSGYPDQLKGEEVPLAARAVAVVDAYATMLEDRCYQQAQSSREAIAELQRCAGTQFDPVVVDALIELLQEQTQEQMAVMSVA